MIYIRTLKVNGGVLYLYQMAKREQSSFLAMHSLCDASRCCPYIIACVIRHTLIQLVPSGRKQHIMNAHSVETIALDDARYTLMQVLTRNTSYDAQKRARIIDGILSRCTKYGDSVAVVEMKKLTKTVVNNANS